MTILGAAGALILVGAIFAINVGGAAEKGARFNARSQFGLAVNSQPNSWRMMGLIFIATGVPIAVWAAAHLT